MSDIEANASFISDKQKARLNAIVLFIGSVLLVNAQIARYLYHSDTHAALVAMVAAIMLGAPLIIQSFVDLWKGRMAMNELAALGVIAAFANKEYELSGLIALFMTIAVLIEYRTAQGARTAIEQLVRMAPSAAHRVNEDGSETEVEAKDLEPGDIVRIRPGDNVPGDGEIVSGSTTINQANITGESFPVEKTVGEEVFGGTINISGLLEVRITKKGTDTTLGRVQELILKAEQSRMPITRFIDSYAYWYTPLILMIAGVVLFFTKNIDTAISLLIIACPGAVILSAPTAMVAALSAAARCGVLIKDVKNLEIAKNLTAIVFDKTGTLTTGVLTVSKLRPLDGVDGVSLLLAAATAEQNSRHPVARAVVRVAKKARLQLPVTTDSEEVAGKGVITTQGEDKIMVGRGTWLEEQGYDLSGINTDDAEGLSLLYVVKNSQVLGWVGLEDQPREDAVGAMDELRELKMKQLVMVTGDRWSVAKKVAATMRCTGVQAEVLPAEKLDMIHGLKKAGHTVAMVGDGVNDAPALAAGNLSIAMGAAGSDVAIESASVALMNSNLNRIPFLVRLSRSSLAIVKQNLAFSVLFVAIFGPLSIAGYISPFTAVVLHLVSDLVVIFNSARLVRFGEDLETTEIEEHEEEEEQEIKPQPVGIAPV